MMTWSVIITLLLMYHTPSVCGNAEGFDLLFTSNKAVYKHLPVPLDQPLPHWLKGKYIRNGLGQFEMGSRNMTHAFDGFAKLSSFEIDPGQSNILFSSQFVHSHFYRDSLKKNNIAPYLLFNSVEPPFNFLERAAALYNGIDNTNINVFKFGAGDLASIDAVSDFWHFYEIDPDTLETRKLVNAELPSGGGIVTKMFPIPSSAHPLKEAGTDNYINFYSLLNPLPGFENSINVMRIMTASKRELIASIPRSRIPYMHSFGLTRRYAVILAHPVIIEVETLLETGNPLRSLSWHPTIPTDVYVVRLDTGRVVKMNCAAYFFMHNINSFEDGDHIVVDMVAYRDLSFLYTLDLGNLRGPEPKLPTNASPTVKRLHINVAKNQVIMSDYPVNPNLPQVNSLDMPVINPKFNQLKHCFVFGLVIGAEDRKMSSIQLVKKDICTNGTRDLVWSKTNHYPTEPWFEPNPNGSEEDDGIVLSLVLDGESRVSYVLFLNGKDFAYISRAQLPTWVPFTLHGRLFDTPTYRRRKYRHRYFTQKYFA